MLVSLMGELREATASLATAANFSKATFIRTRSATAFCIAARMPPSVYALFALWDVGGGTIRPALLVSCWCILVMHLCG